MRALFRHNTLIRLIPRHNFVMYLRYNIDLQPLEIVLQKERNVLFLT